MHKKNIQKVNLGGVPQINRTLEFQATPCLGENVLNFHFCKEARLNYRLRKFSDF